jgi:hypothetical protein
VSPEPRRRPPAGAARAETGMRAWGPLPGARVPSSRRVEGLRACASESSRHETGHADLGPDPPGRGHQRGGRVHRQLFPAAPVSGLAGDHPGRIAGRTGGGGIDRGRQQHRDPRFEQSGLAGLRACSGRGWSSGGMAGPPRIPGFAPHRGHGRAPGRGRRRHPVGPGFCLALRRDHGRRDRHGRRRLPGHGHEPFGSQHRAGAGHRSSGQDAQLPDDPIDPGSPAPPTAHRLPAGGPAGSDAFLLAAGPPRRGTPARRAARGCPGRFSDGPVSRGRRNPAPDRSADQDPPGGGLCGGSRDLACWQRPCWGSP